MGVVLFYTGVGIVLFFSRWVPSPEWVAAFFGGLGLVIMWLDLVRSREVK